MIVQSSTFYKLIAFGMLSEVSKLWIKGCNIIILDVPLLYEAKMDRWTKPNIVVWVDPKIQLKRLMARDVISAQEARYKINAQIPLDVKKSKADLLIDK
ncbi:dephospho-CoA kinase [Tanacetum coccineum]